MNKPNFAQLLSDAINPANERKFNEAYRAFHNYSVGNQYLAATQLEKIGPISTFKGWQEKGRQVKKGSKAIALYMPFMVSKKDQDGNPILDSDGKEVKIQVFGLKNNWFSFYQTEGEDVDPMADANFGEFDYQKALDALDIKLVDFEMANGNAQGYATTGNRIAINPLASLPHKTTFHEMAHQVLGHLAEANAAVSSEPLVLASGTSDRSLQEVEAESVAFICCASLGLSGLAESRQYIQSYLSQIGEIPEKSCRAIFSAADKILKAGR